MDDLLIKYLFGETTPDETVRVLQWLSEDAGNRERYEQLKTVWEISGRNDSSPAPDTQQALQRLKRRVQGAGAGGGAGADANTGAGAKVSYRFLRTWGAAAVFAGIVCIGGGAYWFLSLPAGGPAAKNKTVNPGRIVEPVVADPGSAGLQTDIAGNSVRIDTLPDGSVVTLHKHATITYPLGLKGREREVHLEGAAFFFVVHNPSRPFVVQVNDITVKVIGTSFTIHSIAGRTEIVVRTGIVRVIRGVDSIILYAGEKVGFQKNRRQQGKTDTLIRDTSNYVKRLPAKSDTPDVDKSMQEARAIIEDLVKAKIIANKDSLSWFVLNSDQLVVDGKTMPDSLYRVFRSRYIKPDGAGYYVGPVKIYGRGHIYDKKDLY